jgi:penicillin-binding protein 1A
VEAAARHYFGTSASRLTLSQAALLAGLIRGPSRYDPRRFPDRARERRDLVLALMEHQGRVPAATATAARTMPLGVVRRRAAATADSGLAPYFAEEVRRQLEDRLGERLYDETLTVTTTLDRVSSAAESGWSGSRAVETGALGSFRGPRYSASVPPAAGAAESGTPYLQGAVVSLEVGSGDVLAWVGGRDFHQSRFDRVKSSRRQVGSAFKPFVYAAALGHGHYLSERLSDEPIQVRLGGNRVWEPQNFDQEYDGEVTMRDALARSKNIPTVRLASAVGLKEVAKAAREAGIRSEIEETPAMPLGTVAVSPLELATAYSAFAGLGQVAAPRLLLRIAAEDGSEIFAAPAPRPERVMDDGIAFLITNVLQEAIERGTGTAVRASGFEATAAGKTGTTNDATDTWFVGYTPRLVAAVWMGFDEPRPIMGLATGGRLAAPVWGRMMVRAPEDLTTRATWTAPSTVVQAWIDPQSGRPLTDGRRPYDGEGAPRAVPARAPARAICPDQGRSRSPTSPPGSRTKTRRATATPGPKRWAPTPTPRRRRSTRRRRPGAAPANRRGRTRSVRGGRRARSTSARSRSGARKRSGGGASGSGSSSYCT